MPPTRCSFNNMIGRWKGEHQAYNQTIDGVHSFEDVDIPDDVLGQIDAYNQVTGELCDLIAKAVTSGKTLRAYGSAWSLSKCGVTEHELLNTAALTIGLRPGPTHPDPAYDGAKLDKLRFLECGVSTRLSTNISTARSYRSKHPAPTAGRRWPASFPPGPMDLPTISAPARSLS